MCPATCFRPKWLINARSTQPLCWLVNTISVSVMRKVTDWTENLDRVLEIKQDVSHTLGPVAGQDTPCCLLPSAQYFLFTFLICISVLWHTALSQTVQCVVRCLSATGVTWFPSCATAALGKKRLTQSTSESPNSRRVLGSFPHAWRKKRAKNKRENGRSMSS